MAEPLPVRRAMGLGEWGLLVALATVWGGSFFFGKVAVAELPPLSVVLGRVSLGSAALLAMVYGSGLTMPPPGRAWGPFFVLGALNGAIPFSLIFWSQTHIGSGLASILNATTPLFTALLAHLLTADERLTANRLGGVLLGLAGVAVLVGPAAVRGLGATGLAQLGVLGAAVSYSLGGIYGRRFRGTPPLVTAAGQVTAAAVWILPVACLVDRPWTLAAPSGAALGSVVALALLCTAAAYVAFFRLLAAVGATNVVLVTLLIPVSAVLLGVAFLGETLTLRQAGGMALIAAGLGATDGRLLGWLRRR